MAVSQYVTALSERPMAVPHHLTVSQTAPVQHKIPNVDRRPGVQTGLNHWLQQRAQWTCKNSKSGASAKDINRALQQRRETGKLWDSVSGQRPSRHNLEHIYAKCIQERRPFKRPINLAELMPALLAGWQRDGTWPTGQTAPPDSPPPDVMYL